MKDNSNPSVPTSKKILAIASGGGHWVQLLRLRPALLEHDTLFATTRKGYATDVNGARFATVPDCNRWDKIKLIKAALGIFTLILRERPAAIITTGAAPGYFAVRFGKMFGCRTIWVDSIANAEELSLSGQRAGKHVDHWITQWEHLASPNGPQFHGNVLGEDESVRIDPRAESQEAAHRRRKLFVTVGTDLPFDRLVKTIDQWALRHPDCEVFAQIGESKYVPKNISYCKFIDPSEFKRRFQGSDYAVSHAGMGTILSSLNFQKPLVVLPRISALGEHRNEHQLATAKHLKDLNKVNVAADENELVKLLDQFDSIEARTPIGPHASKSLTNALKDFISK